ncbi:MAG: SAVED domain-containing protein [Chloroflexi bacterium]|nr:SAVED domain-containing protein [Chloroflexota bacterium]
MSNWSWKSDDDLAKSIRGSGTLPDEFFSATKKTRLGKIRELWISHLETDEKTLNDFGRCLRLKLNYFGLVGINEALSDRLYRVGLTPLDSETLVSPYDDLARKFITLGITSFDRDELLTTCRKEKLIWSAPIAQSFRTIGVRSFIPFAENMENEAEAFVCVSEQFDGRHARTDQSWKISSTSIKRFLETQREKLIDEHRILLDCHSSLALVTGYFLTTRAPVFPAGPRPKLEILKPSGQSDITENELWTQKITSATATGTTLAVIISVTHNASPQVLDFLKNSAYRIKDILELTPTNGFGPLSVKNADHAIALADSFIKIVRSCQIQSTRTLLFLSAPNFLCFFIGQRARAIGQIALFEYDFDGPEPRVYMPSISLPQE